MSANAKDFKQFTTFRGGVVRRGFTVPELDADEPLLASSKEELREWAKQSEESLMNHQGPHVFFEL